MKNFSLYLRVTAEGLLFFVIGSGWLFLLDYVSYCYWYIGIGKHFYGEFSDVATGLWRGLFASYAISRVQTGRTSIEDDPKSIGSSTSMDDDHVEKVLAVIRQNRRLTVREVPEEVGICKSSCHLILTEKLKILVTLYPGLKIS